MARESRDTWAKRVERWRASGLTTEEYAAEIGVKANTLKHWSWVLGRDRRSVAPPRRAARQREPAFVEVSPPRDVPQTSAEPIEVVVRDGVRVRVPTVFDVDALRRVIAALEVR
jgi:hypothetical protein